MSRWEWERGEIVLPPAGYAAVKKAVQADHDRMQEERFAAARSLYARLVEEKKAAPRGTPYRAVFNRILAGEDVPYEVRRAVMPDAKTLKPRAPRAKDFPKSSRATTTYHADACEATVTFDDAARTVVWDVPRNNHSCERAHESRTARVLFEALGRVEWPARGRCGGTIVGNDEYNEEDRAAGGGANYVKERFGPAGIDREFEAFRRRNVARRR